MHGEKRGPRQPSARRRGLGRGDKAMGGETGLVRTTVGTEQQPVLCLFAIV